MTGPRAVYRLNLVPFIPIYSVAVDIGFHRVYEPVNGSVTRMTKIYAEVVRICVSEMDADSASFVTYYRVVPAGGAATASRAQLIPPAYCRPSDVSSSSLYRKLRQQLSDNFCNVGARLKRPSLLGSVTGYLHLSLCINSNRPCARKAIKIKVSVRQ